LNNLLLFIGALLVVALAALFAVPHFVDWSIYRGGFETQASKLLGRDVRVGGRVNLRLLPAPYVSFENVRVADQDGRFSEPPLRVEAFTLWLSIAPLLRGAVEASEVELRRPEFLVRMQDQSPHAGANPSAPVTALPMSIALRSVNIRDGVVRVLNPAGADIFKAENVTGEFSAPSLEGPFRFRGGLLHGGRERELRISTGRIEADGGLPFDGTVRVAEQASAYQLKGRITAFATDPTFVGDLIVQPTTERSAKNKQSNKDETLPFYEIKSRLRMGQRDAKLDELAIIFEQAGRPQMLSGQASATFGTEKRLVAVLDARWLDLDRIAGLGNAANQTKAGPYAGLARLVTLAQAWLPSGVATNLRLGVEQATLGGDTVNRIELALEQGQGKESLSVSRFSADVPGSGRIRLSGVIGGMQGLQSVVTSPAPGQVPPGEGQGAGAGLPVAPAPSQDGETLTFLGPVQLHGQNLGRFLAWVAPGNNLQKQDVASSFSLSGKLSLGRGRIGLAQMRGDLATTSFEGDASFGLASANTNNRPDFVLSIDSDRLDLRPFLTGNAKLEDIWRRILGERGSIAPTRAGLAPKGDPPAEAVAGVNGFADRLDEVNSEIRLRAGRLLLPDIELRDVDADVGRTETSTAIRTLRFVSSNGLKVQADGQIQSVEGRRRGALKTVVELDHPAALSALLRFIDLSEGYVLEPRAATVMPLRLAGILTLGVRGGTGFEFLVDGAAQDTRTSIVVRGDQEPASWRSGLLDVTAVLENAKSSQLLAQLLPGIAPMSLGAGEQGRLSVRANGIPRSGISTAIEFESKAVEAGFSGVITLSGDKPSMAGEIGLKAADVADALRLAGLKSVRALQGRDLVLHTRISANGEEIKINDAALRLGSASAEALGRMVRRDGRLEVDMTAKAADASVPALLAIALGTGLGGSGKDKLEPAGAVGAAARWADEAIDLAALGEIGGKVRLEAGTLSLGQSLELQKSVIELELTPSSVEIRSLTGEALGGRLSANARMEKSQTGIALKGTAKFDGGVLEKIIAAEGAAPVASGAASGVLAFTGRGLTPRGIIGSLTGTGSLQLKDARLARYGAEALEAAVALVLSPAKADAGKTDSAKETAAKDGTDVGEFKVDPATFKAAIAAQLAKTPLVIGSRSIPLEIADGVVKSKLLAFDVPRGRIKGTNVLDLPAMQIDSDWTIETLARFDARSQSAESAGSGKSNLGSAAAALQIPSINLAVAGSIADLPRLTPQVNSDALARELLVRRMERDVEQLEQSRKKRDEDEALRLKQKEQEKVDVERQSSLQRKKEELEAAKAQTVPTDRDPGKAGTPALPGSTGSLGSGAAGIPVPIPTPVPLQSDAGQPMPSSPATLPTPAETGAVPKTPSAFSSPPPVSRPRSDMPASPPPKVSRPPSVFDQSRGL
jgi:uncharacterized protein involved in outer membrane biogenesis